MKNILLTLSLAIGLFAYLNILPNEFVWDDTAIILENTAVQSPSGITKFFAGPMTVGTLRTSPYFRPIYMTSLWLDYQIWGLTPWGFHLTNIFFHLLNAALLFFLMFHLSRRPEGAFFASTLFVVHPVLTASVTNIAGRDWLICTAFVFLALLSFISYRENPEKREKLLLSNLFFFLGILVRENVMIFPLFLILYDGFRSFQLKENFRRHLKSHFLFWIIILIYLTLRLTVINFGWFEQVSYDLHLDRRFYTAPTIFFAYLVLLVFPKTLRLERSIPFAKSLAEPAALISLLGLIASIAFMIFLIRKRRAPIFVFGVLWMMIAMIPILNIFPLRAIMEEAWFYPVGVGYSIGLAALFLKGIERFPKPAWSIFSLVMVLFFCRTITRNLDWQNALVLYEKSVKDSPDSYKLQFNLGVTYANLGRHEDAKREFDKMITDKHRYMKEWNRNLYQE